MWHGKSRAKLSTHPRMLREIGQAGPAAARHCRSTVSSAPRSLHRNFTGLCLLCAQHTRLHSLVSTLTGTNTLHPSPSLLLLQLLCQEVDSASGIDSMRWDDWLPDHC